MSVITLTTDFGVGSPYAAAMKGVMLSMNPAVTLVDLTHEVPPQNVRHAAVVLGDVCHRFPEGTIHVVVVDPGVGTDRAIVYARVGSQSFIAPDNGVLSKVVGPHPPSKLLRLTNKEYWAETVSATFHGRDIMAPAAAHLSLGLEPDKLGPPIESLDQLKWAQPTIQPRRIDGTVLEVDSFGNLITNIEARMLAGRPTDGRACVVCGLYETWGIYSAYAQQHEDSFVALIGSNDRLELALVGGNASKRLNIGVGTKVTVAWE